ncbi:Alpha-amylase [Grifola frondosa]|uniref:alpha-amylase n=1 Tax=Grifola frondosa TaxID=5627 RepID=A0A1C7MN21_GRIFR|nr:Alpha-amylase [Grifola frondosa]
MYSLPRSRRVRFRPSEPPQEHIQGSQWWTDYQPVSYILTSKRGNRTQFENMITTCHNAGVGVVVDTIFNHMTGIASGTGDFHHCGLEPGDAIVNWDNTLEVWTCQLDGLADLGTDTDYVRGVLAAYANDLLSLGADGMRLDAAKNINVSDIANILSRLSGTPYITQEVIWGAGQPVTPNEYTGNGDVQEFRYTTALQNAFLGGGISSLESFDNLGWVPGTQANVFVTNPDTERNGGSLNDNSPSNTYVTAMIFSLAHPYGTPTILSSYSGFTNTDAGAPNGGTGTCSGSGGLNGWLCQHRWTAVAGMAGFRNNVGDSALQNWVSPQSDQIAFGRGALGFVAINNDDSAWTTNFVTAVPDGSYCDVISGASLEGNCTGSSFSVSGEHSAQPFQSERRCNPHRCNGHRFRQWTSSEHFVVGSISQLGDWDPASAIALSAASYPVWTVSVSVPANTEFQYKFIRKETDGSIVWESDPNRDDTSPASGSQTIDTSWR